MGPARDKHGRAEKCLQDLGVWGKPKKRGHLEDLSVGEWVY
jgi:hypothetical protein